jgi:hypothetical protein
MRVGAPFRARWWRCGIGVALLSAAGCAGDGATSTPRLTWTPVDSVNAALPPGIRVYAGRNAVIPLRAWYAEIDEPSRDIETRISLSDDLTDRRETVSSFASLPRACLAVNGGYFSMDYTPAIHAGLLYADHQLYAPATRTVTRDSVSYRVARAAIGFTSTDDVELEWVTTEGDTLYAWSRPPPNRPGAPAEFPAAEARPWLVRDALSAGPMLVRDSAIRVTTDAEVFFGSAIPNVHPRTAAGRTGDGKLLVLVIDGRQPESKGVTLEELAAIMRDLGAVDALNLDGGGSSALVVHGVLLNRPAGNTNEREVMSALVTFCVPPTPDLRDTP